MKIKVQSIVDLAGGGKKLFLLCDRSDRKCHHELYLLPNISTDTERTICNEIKTQHEIDDWNSYMKKRFPAGEIVELKEG